MQPQLVAKRALVDIVDDSLDVKGGKGLFRYQFVACAAYIDNADAGVAGEDAAEAGDENLEAAGVEEVVVAPKVQEDVLGGDDFALMLAKALEDIGFPARQDGGFS